MKHYTEADLLELHYGGERDSAAQHLSECSECTGKFVSVKLKLLRARSEACGNTESKPTTFWSRQRVAITRAIDAKHTAPARRLRTVPRFAFVAMLIAVLSLGVLTVSNRTEQSSSVQTVVSNTSPDSGDPQGALPDAELVAALTSTVDPWETDELRGYREVVEWESWIETDQSGGNTL